MILFVHKLTNFHGPAMKSLVQNHLSDGGFFAFTHETFKINFPSALFLFLPYLGHAWEAIDFCMREKQSGGECIEEGVIG
jgi:hypothetical protein